MQILAYQNDQNDVTFTYLIIEHARMCLNALVLIRFNKYFTNHAGQFLFLFGQYFLS